MPVVLIRGDGFLQIRSEVSINRAAGEMRPIKQNLHSHDGRPASTGGDLVLLRIVDSARIEGQFRLPGVRFRTD
jgi:hypothetical protein